MVENVEIVRYLLVVVEVLSSVLLVAVILMQKTKSQGMGMAFGSAMGESLFGPQVGNVLTKATVILAAIFLLNTTVLALMGSGAKRTSVTERATTEQPAQSPGPTTPPPGTPPSGTPAPETPAPTTQTPVTPAPENPPPAGKDAPPAP